jgi:hypothetical protein
MIGKETNGHPIGLPRPHVIIRAVNMWPQTLVVVLATLLLVLLVDQVTDRREPVAIESIRLAPESVAAGQDLQVHTTMKVSRQCPGTLTRTLISTGEGTPVQVTDQVPLTLADSELSSTIRTIHVPPGFPEGPAVYRSEASFACNAVQGYWPIRIKGPEATLAVEAAAPPVQAVATAAAVPLPLLPPARRAARPVTRPAPAAPPAATNPLLSLFSR